MTSRSGRPGKASVSFDKVLAGATPVERSVRICLAGDILAELDVLSEELAQAQRDDAMLNRPPRAGAIAQEIVTLTDLAKESEVEFRFRAIGRRAWRDLAAEHPPTEEDRKANLDFNAHAFPTAAMAASCVAPEGASVEAFQELADSDKVTEAQWRKLWAACHAANTGGADVPFNVAAFALARPSEMSSGSPEATESLEASS